MKFDVGQIWTQVVREQGNRTALLSPREKLSFTDLDRRSDAVCQAVQDRSISLLGIRGADHFAAVIGMLGALKAKVPFALVDSDLSDHARTHITRVLDDPLWLDQLITPTPNPATWPRERLSCTGSRPTSSDEPDPDAYVLFTSGSTGLPKGARIGITNFKSYIDAIISRLRLTADDTWLQVASLGFDVVIEEVFPVLFAGGAVAIRPDSHDHDPATLQRDLHQSRATVVELSTSYWYEYQRWLHAEHACPPSTLRTLVVGGERMDSSRYREWQRRFSPRLVHVYGLTECTVSSTMYDGILDDAASDVPLGTPLQNSTIHIAIPGACHAWWATSASRSDAVGEIVVTGDGVGYGYAAESEEAGARFHVHPDGIRSYRTGDLGLIDDRGDLIFKGRIDDQVKIRGRRIELAELDRALSAVRMIRQAAAVVMPGPPQQVIVFVIPDIEQIRVKGEWSKSKLPQTISPASGSVVNHFLRCTIAEQAPSWAQPSVVHLISCIPLTARGKIDRNALVQYHLATAETAAPGPDRTTLNTSLVQRVLVHFCTALNNGGLGPDDDFFINGGDSLLALQLITSLREEFVPSQPLRPRSLYRLRTPTRIAAYLAQGVDDCAHEGNDSH